MTDTEFDSYCKERYEDQLKYFNTRAQSQKRGHTWCSLYLFAVSVLIAPLQFLGDDSRVATTVLAPTLALVSGIAAFFKFNEEWLSARTTWDALIPIRFQDEPNSGSVSAWQDHAGLIHSLLSRRN